MTVTHLEQATPPRASSAPSRQPGYKSLYSNRRLNLPNNASIVSAKQFVPAIEAVIAPMEAELRLLGEQTKFGTGAVTSICHNGARLSSGFLSHDQLIRRLYGIRNGETRMMKANLADALAMGAGTDLKELDVMELPAGDIAARERVDIWMELHRGSRPELSEDQLADLADDLLEFTRLMVHGPAEDYPEECFAPEVNTAICQGLEVFFATMFSDLDPELDLEAA